MDRKHSKFASDPDVPAAFRADNSDYRGSRLSRGHLAPAGAHKQSQAALDETFNLSANILPQELSNNGSDWLRLERFARKLTGSYAQVYVVSGPLFLPEGEAPVVGVPRQPLREVASGGSKTSSNRPPSAPIRKRVAYDVIGPHEVACVCSS